MTIGPTRIIKEAARTVPFKFSAQDNLLRNSRYEIPLSLGPSSTIICIFMEPLLSGQSDYWQEHSADHVVSLVLTTPPFLRLDSRSRSMEIVPCSPDRDPTLSHQAIEFLIATSSAQAEPQKPIHLVYNSEKWVHVYLTTSKFYGMCM